MSYTSMGTTTATAIVSREDDRSGNFVADGAADDVEINAAITYINAVGGGNLVVLYGAYLITAVLALTGTIHVNLTRATLTLGYNGDMFTLTGNYNIVEYGILEGDKANFAGRCFVLTDCYDCYIVKNKIHAFDLAGIEFGGTLNSRVWILENHINDVDGNGIYLTNTNDTFLVMNVVISSGAGGIYILGCGSLSIFQNQCYENGNDGIHVTNNNISMICNNNCGMNGRDGLRLSLATTDAIVDGNMLNDANGGYGINIAAATVLRTTIGTNNLHNNTTGCIQDLGTDTQLPTVVLPFVEGGDATGPIHAQFIHADGSPKGWEIDANNEWAIALGVMPQGCQQSLRIKVWAVSLAATAAGVNMRLELVANAGRSGEAFNAEAIAVANHDSVETNLAINDIVHWIFDATDDVDIDDLVAGDEVEIKVKHEAADGEAATDAVFRCATIEYV